MEKVKVQTQRDARKNATRFSESDAFLLENTDEELLKRAIDCLKVTREVLWVGDDRQTKLPLSELLKQNPQCEPRPYYPSELTDLVHAFLTLREQNPYRNEDNADTECLYPTFCSPTDIVEYMTFAFVRDHVCVGFFARGVESGKWLKMLLHLQDCVSAWKEGNNEHI